jgi:hypothetical protein
LSFSKKLTSGKYILYTENVSTPGESFRLRGDLTEKEGVVEIIISSIVGLIVGAVGTKVVMGVASSAGTVVRGVAKEVIKGGLVIQEAASDMCSGGGNYFSDLFAEAKADLAATPTGETMPAKAKMIG